MQATGMIVFSVLTLLAIFASLFYVPRRLGTLLELKWRRSLVSGYIGVAFLYPLTLGIERATGTTLLDPLVVVGSIVIGVHLYLTLSLLLMELLRTLLPLVEWAVALGAIALALACSLGGVVHGYGLGVNEVEILLPGLGEEVRVVHVSDAHIGPQRGRVHLKRLVERVNALEPQLVLLNGDLIDGNAALEPGVLDPLGTFTAPVYFTTGNHESYVDTERALALIEKLGVRVLHNEVVKTHGLQLIGLDYMNADDETFDLHAVNAMTLEEELPKIPLEEGVPSLLMHHSPVGLEYVQARGVNVMVSGHTHAGQVFPVTLLAGLIFPIGEGLHQRGSTSFLVSQGAGTYGPRMRLGSSNQIDLILLKPAPAK